MMESEPQLAMDQEDPAVIDHPAPSIQRVTEKAVDEEFLTSSKDPELLVKWRKAMKSASEAQKLLQEVMDQLVREMRDRKGKGKSHHKDKRDNIGKCKRTDKNVRQPSAATPNETIEINSDSDSSSSSSSNLSESDVRHHGRRHHHGHRDRSHSRGRDRGRDRSHSRGHSRGRSRGHSRGHSRGRSRGHSRGHSATRGDHGRQHSHQPLDYHHYRHHHHLHSPHHHHGLFHPHCHHHHPFENHAICQYDNLNKASSTRSIEETLPLALALN